VPADGHLLVYELSGRQPDAGRLGLPAGRPLQVCLALPADGGIALREVTAAAVPLAQAVPVLLQAPARPAAGTAAGVMASDGLATWQLATRLALRLITAQRIAPTLVRGDAALLGVWRALVEGDHEARGALVRLAAAMPHSAHAIARGPGAVWEPQALLGTYLDAVADLAVRRGVENPRSSRPRERLLPWTARWAEALTDDHDAGVPVRDDAEELLAGVAAWQSTSAAGEGGTAELVLAAPDTQDGWWRLEFRVRADDGTAIPAAQVWGKDAEEADGALQQALLAGLGRASRLFEPVDAALRDPAPEGLDLDLEQAWRFIRDVAPVLDEGGVLVTLPSELASSELTVRLRVGAGADDADEAMASSPLDEPDDSGEAGDAGAPREAGDLAAGAPLSVAELPGVHRVGDGGRGGDGGRRGGGVGAGLLAGLLTDFRWEHALGGETLTQEEFDVIVSAQAPLVRYRDRWVRVDPQRAQRLRALGTGGEMPLAEALALGLAGSGGEGDWQAWAADRFAEAHLGDLDDVEVVADGGLARLIERLRDAGERPVVAETPPGFAGELRHYQRRGVAWLQGMGQLGLGAVLADDMGLGKTIELIAHLLARPAGEPHLIVCPTSVLGNWEREINRFAPDLPVRRHHGPDRARDLTGVRGVVVTTYGTARRDVEVLTAVDWDVVTLDEAQHVKNPATAGARAVRRFHGRQTVAMTGTPLENRLAELWSLLDVTNPGLLGTRAAFGRRFAGPIEQHRNPRAARRLRRLIAPFVLRREKSDPTVIADLPDKIERTLVCSLTPEQAGLYQAAVDAALGRNAGDGDGDGSEAGSGAALARVGSMERRGRILALLTQLKQICNHPAQYLREDNPTLLGRSGKLAVARDIIEEATDAGEQLLVFTQYVEMGRLLARQLSADLAMEVPFLHGGVPAASRDRLVAAFQGDDEAVAALDLDRPPSVLIVSLRAGGTGLNLTAASHVVHYDRWWNPAVEDQATDRAHRIGQRKTVSVHKLVTTGTVEERVATILERKRELADAVVGAGEAWVTELGDDELAELVTLAADATIAELDDDDGSVEEVAS